MMLNTLATKNSMLLDDEARALILQAVKENKNIQVLSDFAIRHEGDGVSGPEIEYYLKLNRYGRRLFDSSNVLVNLWPTILSRMTRQPEDADALLYFMREYFSRQDPTTHQQEQQHRAHQKQIPLLVFSSIEDDSSIGSTVTVSSTADSEQVMLEPMISSESSLYAVQFNEMENKYVENTQMCRDEIEELWYSRVETRDFRKEANSLAREVANSERKIASISSYKNVLHRTFDSCRECDFETNDVESILTWEDQETLSRRVRESTERLGLERLSCRKLGDDRFERRKKICKMLLGLQASMEALSQKNESNNVVCDFVAHDAKAQIIRASCQEVSRPSRLFARELAAAFLDDD